MHELPLRQRLDRMNSHALEAYLAAILVLGSTTDASAGLSDASTGFPNPMRSAPAAPKPSSPRQTSLPKGLSLEIVAGEREVNHPMGVDFDHQGRLLVLELYDASPLQSRLNRLASKLFARIVTLTDTDGDGRMDTRQLFVDRLDLPASIIVRGPGVYVDQPDGVIWLQDSNGDGRADQRQAVVSTQPERPAESGSGPLDNLLLTDRMFANLDTWIYSPRYQLRFKPLHGKLNSWIHEPLIDSAKTIWSHDQSGRLIHANARLGFHTEPVPYRFRVRNPHYVPDIQNHGDSMSSSDVSSPEAESARFLNATQSVARKEASNTQVFHRMGSAIYQGDLLPAQYHGALFTCDPERGEVRYYDLPTSVEPVRMSPAVDHGIFMSLDEEAFTPVQIQNGPDGALYLVDLGDGLMKYLQTRQDRRLKNPRRPFQKYRATGRILRIANSSREREKIVQLPQNPSLLELSSRFVGNRGFWRDAAQGILIETPYPKSARMLEEWVCDHQRLVGNQESTPVAVRLRALWTLEGQGQLTGETLKIALEDPDSTVRSAALQITAALPIGPLKEGGMAWVLSRASAFPRTTYPSLLICLGAMATPQADNLMRGIVLSSPTSVLLDDIVVSGLAGRELRFIRQLTADPLCGPDQNRHGRLLMKLGDCLQNSGNMSQIEEALDLASNLPEGDWKVLALLSGLSGKESAGGANLPGNAVPPPPERPQPSGLTKLRLSQSSEIQNHIRCLSSRYRWSSAR